MFPRFLLSPLYICTLAIQRCRAINGVTDIETFAVFERIKSSAKIELLQHGACQDSKSLHSHNKRIGGMRDEAMAERVPKLALLSVN